MEEWPWGSGIPDKKIEMEHNHDGNCGLFQKAVEDGIIFNSLTHF